jgi:hypothetical protein
MFDELIRALEGVRDAIDSKDTEEALAALTFALMQIADLFGHSPKHFAALAEPMEELKGYLEAKDFDEATTVTLLLLAKFRATREVSAKKYGV